MTCAPNTLLNNSTGLDHFQPLNCHACPCAKTAATNGHSSLRNLTGLSTTRNRTVLPPLRVWVRLCSGSRFTPLALFSSTLTYRPSRRKSTALRLHSTLERELGTIKIAPPMREAGGGSWAGAGFLRGTFVGRCWGGALAASLSRPEGCAAPPSSRERLEEEDEEGRRCAGAAGVSMLLSTWSWTNFSAKLKSCSQPASQSVSQEMSLALTAPGLQSTLPRVVAANSSLRRLRK